MDFSSAPQREEERCMLVRARGAKDGGGAASPSTVEGKLKLVKIFLEMKCLSLLLHARLGDAPKGTSPGLGGGAESFFLFRIVFAKR